MAAKQQWAFQPRFRAKAYGWRGSKLAVERLREAVSEIQKAGRTDALLAADGAVLLFTRLWPALQQIDGSSGVLGSAVHWTQEELLPLVTAAPADRKTRKRWLERLWAAIEEDGVDYLAPVQDRWGELCGSAELASLWADRLVEVVRGALSGRVLSEPDSVGYSSATSVCLSSLLAAGRHEEIFELLGLERFPFWHYRKFGVAALEKEGRLEEALQFAEASRGLNQPDRLISEVCARLRGRVAG
jgi:hypothetical protein